MTQPLVVVVTPVYNGAAHLEETLRSVQAQTYPNTLHLILDNASTDATPEIIERYRDGRVPLLVTRNETLLPQRDNWNRAFELVPEEAEYVRLLCADDTIAPDCLTETVALAETDPEIGVVGSLHTFYGTTHEMFWPEDRQVFDGPEAVRMILLNEGVLFAVQTLIRKRLADQRQPLFAPALGGGMDLDTLIDLIGRSKFGFVHKNLAFTRIHEDSVTSKEAVLQSRALTRYCLHLLTHYGPAAFGHQYQEQLKRFRRYYVRRILRWGREVEDATHIESHKQAIEQAGWRFGPVLMADAIVDWVLIRLGFRTAWTGFPGWE